MIHEKLQEDGGLPTKDTNHTKLKGELRQEPPVFTMVSASAQLSFSTSFRALRVFRGQIEPLKLLA
jgi:hypothetical protein